MTIKQLVPGKMYYCRRFFCIGGAARGITIKPGDPWLYLKRLGGGKQTEHFMILFSGLQLNVTMPKDWFECVLEWKKPLTTIEEVIEGYYLKLGETVSLYRHTQGANIEPGEPVVIKQIYDIGSSGVVQVQVVKTGEVVTWDAHSRTVLFCRTLNRTP